MFVTKAICAGVVATPIETDLRFGVEKEKKDPVGESESTGPRSGPPEGYAGVSARGSERRSEAVGGDGPSEERYTAKRTARLRPTPAGSVKVTMPAFVAASSVAERSGRRVVVVWSEGLPRRIPKAAVGSDSANEKPLSVTETPPTAVHTRGVTEAIDGSAYDSVTPADGAAICPPTEMRSVRPTPKPVGSTKEMAECERTVQLATLYSVPVGPWVGRASTFKQVRGLRNSA